MPNEPSWLPIEVVIEHNRLEAEATGEPYHLRDRGLLESALARPRDFFAFGEEDIVVLAVVLMAGIARAHAFEQADKRTAFEAMWHFLRLNGYDLAIEDSRPWADEIIASVERGGFPARGSPFRRHHRVTRTKRLRPSRSAASVPAWQTSGCCAPPARSRDFGTAGT